MDIKSKQIIANISEAYESILSEGKEAKFKVGDKVGIGSFSSYGYSGNDTGTVTKVNGHGHHTVEYDLRKSGDDSTKPYIGVFDHSGKSRNDLSRQLIVPIEDHDKVIADRNARQEHSIDMEKILSNISGARNGFGYYTKFDKPTAEHIKSLIDKHTVE